MSLNANSFAKLESRGVCWEPVIPQIDLTTFQKPSASGRDSLWGLKSKLLGLTGSGNHWTPVLFVSCLFPHEIADHFQVSVSLIQSESGVL